MTGKKNANTQRPKGRENKTKKAGESIVVKQQSQASGVSGCAALKQRVEAEGIHNPTLRSFFNAGSEVSSKEVALKITKYIDWDRSESDTDFILNAVYDMEQDLLAPDGSNNVGFNSVLSRVKRCRLSAYPRSVNAQNASSIFGMLTSVPVIGGGGNAELASHQQVVIVPPTFTPVWHKVFDCDYDKLFESAQVSPVDSINFPLFNTQVIDVDAVAPTMPFPKVQLKIEIWVNQTVPLRSQIKFGSVYQSDYVNSRAVAEDTEAFVQVLGMSDRT